MARESQDLKKLKDLIKIMNDNDLVEVEIAKGDERISLKRSHPTPYPPFLGHPVSPGQSGPLEQRSPAHHLPESDSHRQKLLEIPSPIIGTFYRAPSPDANAYVEEGSHVNSETVVCMIEAMKVMNEIKSEVTGTIVDILVKNGQAVEYGQTLFRVRPD